jgi:hypothetical protein
MLALFFGPRYVPSPHLFYIIDPERQLNEIQNNFIEGIDH